MMTTPAVSVPGGYDGRRPPGAAQAVLAGAALVMSARRRLGAALAWDSAGQDEAGQDEAGPDEAAGMALGGARAAVGPAVEVMMVDFSGRKLVAAWPERAGW